MNTTLEALKAEALEMADWLEKGDPIQYDLVQANKKVIEWINAIAALQAEQGQEPPRAAAYITDDGLARLKAGQFASVNPLRNAGYGNRLYVDPQPTPPAEQRHEPVRHQHRSIGENGEWSEWQACEKHQAEFNRMFSAREARPVFSQPTPQPLTDEQIDALAYRHGITSHQIGGVVEYSRALLAAQEGK